MLAVEGTVMSPATPQEQILQITVGFFQSRALAVAADLEIADHLSTGPLHVDQLAASTHASAAMLSRLLHALETIGIFSEVAANTFANTAASECLRRDVVGSQWSWIRSQLSPGNGIYDAWSEFGNTVRTGETGFLKLFQEPFFEYLRGHPARCCTLP